MKVLRVLILIGMIGVCAFLGVVLVANMNAGDPVQSAMRAAFKRAEDMGWPVDKMITNSYETPKGVLGGTGYFEFKDAETNPTKLLRVDVRRPLYSSNWEVIGSSERPFPGRLAARQEARFCLPTGTDPADLNVPLPATRHVFQYFGHFA
jgi:hypothetical protein